MKILFDQGTPVPLRRYLTGHEVSTAYYNEGWSQFENGELLQAAEDAGFQIFVTTDQNLKYQQNLETRNIAFAVLLSTSWPKIRSNVDLVIAKINTLSPVGYVEIEI